jgi:hypothetical protein
MRNGEISRNPLKYNYTTKTAVEAKYTDTASGTRAAIAVYRGGPGRQMYRSQLSFASRATMWA